MALVRNLVDGCIKSIEYVFAEDGILLDAVGRQLHNVSDEVGIQVRSLLYFSLRCFRKLLLYHYTRSFQRFLLVLFKMSSLHLIYQKIKLSLDVK